MASDAGQAAHLHFQNARLSRWRGCQVNEILTFDGEESPQTCRGHLRSVICSIQSRTPDIHHRHQQHAKIIPHTYHDILHCRPPTPILTTFSFLRIQKRNKSKTLQTCRPAREIPSVATAWLTSPTHPTLSHPHEHESALLRRVHRGNEAE